MTSLVPPNPADETLDRVEAAFRAIPDLRAKLRDGIARAVDEIVDPVRSARWTITNLDQPEKTVIGIRVENVLRMELELQRAQHLDMIVAGENVDVKFTIGTNWQIPLEAHGAICLLTSFREADHTASAGLLRTVPEALNPGSNRDRKRGVSMSGRAAIRWLIKDEVAGLSIIGFMAGLTPELRSAVTDPAVGAQVRLNRLFTALKDRPIPEALVQAVAQHKDWCGASKPRSP